MIKKVSNQQFVCYFWFSQHIGLGISLNYKPFCIDIWLPFIWGRIGMFGTIDEYSDNKEYGLTYKMEKQYKTVKMSKSSV